MMQSHRKSYNGASRISLVAPVVAVCTLAIAVVALAVEALAHHPGSHARREAGQVVLEAVAVTSDACTRASSINAGAPAGTAAVTGRLAATLRLERPVDAACATVVGRTEIKALLPDMNGAETVHLYIVDRDGKLLATERVPIK